MSGDAELDAMLAMKEALEVLEPEVQERVVWWAIKRFDLSVKTGSGNGSKDEDLDEDDSADQDSRKDHGGGEGVQFEFFAELYDAAGPTTDKDRLLVACYWQQKIIGEVAFHAFSLNKELKNLGHGVDDISRKLDALIKEKPALVLQLKKAGSTRQAKKTYKLTVEGIKKVEAMIAGGGS